MRMGMIPDHEEKSLLGSEQIAFVRSELNSILKSQYFSGSKRCQDFLEFIVNHALEGNYDYLTERFLGAELFGRPINYETGSDSIVRVRANDVRRRLTAFYAGAHATAPVVIELISGSYVPEFHWPAPKTVAPPSVAAPGEASLKPEAADEPSAASAPDSALTISKRSRPFRLSAGLISLAIVLGTCLGWWLRERTLNRLLDPLQYEPALNTLWSGFLHSSHENDIVLSDVSFQLLEDIEKRPFTLTDYLNRSYVDQKQSKTPSPEMEFVLTLIASKNFGNSSEFRLAERMMVLDRAGNSMHIYNARDYSPALATQNNVILIGSPYSNPWQQLFEGRLNFKENPPGIAPGTVINSSPRNGESATYSPSDSVGYCIVAYLPNPDRGTKALIIQGTSSEATEAGGDFLLSEDKFAGFENILHSQRTPYFEVLLKTAQVRGTPITATVEAYRTYQAQP